MEKYFGIPLEFDKSVVESTIEKTSLVSKGYCCFVDSYVLSKVSGNNREKNCLLVNALENSVVNACDGSYIALLAARLYKKNFSAYNGPELFSKYIYCKDKQCIIGNTSDVFDKVKARLVREGYTGDNISFIDLPFCDIDSYNYQVIAERINGINPRYIWVSLGAPKQELFMYRMVPFINRGMLLGIGAAVNFYSGEIGEIPSWAIKTHMIWLYRIFTEPKKQIKRSFFIFKNIFDIYSSEKKKLKNINDSVSL